MCWICCCFETQNACLEQHMLTYAGKALGNWSAMWILFELMRRACGSTAGSLTPAHDNTCRCSQDPSQFDQSSICAGPTYTVLEREVSASRLWDLMRFWWHHCTIPHQALPFEGARVGVVYFAWKGSLDMQHEARTFLLPPQTRVEHKRGIKNPQKRNPSLQRS